MAQPTTDFGHKTLETMRNAVYAKIRRKSTDPLEGLSTSYVDSYIAKWDAYFVDAARWNLPGFKRRKIVQNYTGTTVKTAFAAAATAIELTDNTNAASGGGRINVNGDLIDYSAKDTPNAGYSITVSTVADKLTPDIAHIAGERVEFLVPLPSDCGKPGEIWIGNANTDPYAKLFHQDMRGSYKPHYPYYFSDDGYLLLPDNISTGQLLMHYWKKGMKLVAGNDLQTPERWDDIVLYGAMAECHLVTKEYELADTMFMRAGLPNPLKPDSELNGLLQYAIGRDAQQTDSEDEIFIPDLGSYHL